MEQVCAFMQHTRPLPHHFFAEENSGLKPRILRRNPVASELIQANPGPRPIPNLTQSLLNTHLTLGQEVFFISRGLNGKKFHELDARQ